MQKSGSWFHYDGNNIAQGRENTKVWLEENPEQAKLIEERIRASVQQSDIELDVE